MVVQTDKCLGSGAKEPKEYFRFSIKDQIVDTQTYQRLTPLATSYSATSVRRLLEKWIKKYLDVIIKEEIKFLCTNLRSSEEPWGFLYLPFKVHKVQLNTCPIVLYCLNLLHPLGQLITERLQTLAVMQKS